MPVRVPAPPSAPTELEPLLRRRLVLVATIAALTATFFSTYRRTSPGELNFYLQTSFGTGALIFEATFGGLALALAGTMWFVPRWFTLARLRTVEFLILGCFAIYIGWTQLFAWNGRRFGLAPGQTIDPFFVRLAVDSMAARWFALIVGISVLVPETFRRNNMLVALQAGIAMTLTVIMSLSDPAYRPHFWRIVALMLFWMGVASTVAILGAYKMAELRRQVAEARRFGQYQLIRKIGGGGMGEVHLAEHVLLKQPCAVKLIRPERAGDPGALERFEREVRATAQLKHWNTVQIYDYGYTDDGTFYYAMEYLPGLTLEQIVSQYGPLPPARTIHLLRQLCAALREAHGMNLVHRDIKPANVMVCERGGVFDVAKLLDFGLVRGGGPQAETLPEERFVAGTPGYMAPEQATGRTIDGRTDIYSLGAVAYYLLTGQHPFVRSSVIQVMLAQMTEEIRRPRDVRPEVPMDVEGVVLRCLSRQPDERFRDIGSLDAALSGCGDAAGWSQLQAEAWWREHKPTARPMAEKPSPETAPTQSVMVTATQLIRRDNR
jgi:tRNA A-37 threonylcarbamoyl transferase component Bud32